MASCRVCASPTGLILDLGTVPLANSFVLPGEAGSEPTFPLGLQFCPTCGIAQIPETVDPDVLFRHYLYTPSASSTWRAHCDELAAWIRERVGKLPDPFVVEPASNDGCLLKAISGWTSRVLGVEPARNIAEQARREGVPTVSEFFSQETAQQLLASYGKADVIVGTNVLAHVPDILDFLAGAADLLRHDGFLVIEAPYLRDLVESLSYDTIYHEHVSYLSVTALDNAFHRAGLELTEVERIPIHGGSLRFVGRRIGSTRSEGVEPLLEEERRLGYADGSALIDFADRVNQLRVELRQSIDGLRADGLRLAAYGATAKGNTLMSTCGIGREDIEYVVDRNPLKQGRLTPGTHIPVKDPSAIENEPVDVLLILAWNLRDEIVRQEAAFAERGGRFLIPIPSPTLV
jgi:novobiocin biosynthesis protein NovU/D-mycarose 3-C-methyltransferase